MKVEDLPVLARAKLENQRSSRKRDELRKEHESRNGVENTNLRHSKGKVIKLLENKGETLSELQQEYTIAPSAEIMCNPSKLQGTTIGAAQRAGRTAGHFGLFSPCGIGRAVDIFYLDESLSQC